MRLRPATLIDRVLGLCVSAEASEVFFHAGHPATLRVDGCLRAFEMSALEPSDIIALVDALTPPSNQNELAAVGNTTFEYAFGDKGRFQVSVLKKDDGIALELLVIRGSTGARSDADK